MRRHWLLALILLPALAPAQARQSRAAETPRAAASPAFDSVRFGALRWRSIGPHRGGRSVAAVGVPTQPLVYYAGYTGGGVWKTEDAGTTWRNISDCCFRMGSVGGIAVADSDPNVLYVGMGEHAIRGQSSSYGDGVYKSTDAGRTWTHVGLTNTRQISRVIIHPKNPDVVYVAAQGTRWAPSADRGIYRTTDGGRTWSLLLHPSDSVGASELAMDATNPRILYAAFWQHQRVPWQVRSGGTLGGIWKSTDGGDTWTKLTNGLPRVVGKIGVAVSPANPDRVFAIVEADSGGLYRSDDAGKSWRLLNGDRLIRTRSWYYMKVFADPQNADVVYVLNAPILKSIDGGRTFTVLPAKHGDNHQLWINPLDTRYLINANDGGVTISINGGRTWSTQDNQPTAQIYHLITDERLPYWLYGAQQDNSTIAIASATTSFGIGPGNWHPTAGCETAHIAFDDPRNPRYFYGGCYQGLIEELDEETGLDRNIMAYPALTLAEPTSEMRYRFNWSAPILTSPHDRRVLYHAANVLFRSNDRGFTWTTISPDLTKNDPATMGFGGTPITNEGAGGENYNTIYTVVESPHEAGTIWVGTDDGNVQLTRDGGRTWSNVSPRNAPSGQINSIEVSPMDRATAYITIYRVKLNDFAPYVYRTTDYGRSWTNITGNLPAAEAARVVRAGQRRPGVLFAGTETGVYVTFDDGARWHPLQSNLPRVPITDLQIRNGDLVASTEGRAFWILDDLQPIPQGIDTTTATRLFQPRDAVRRAYGNANEPPAGAIAGQNPPNGATIYFHLDRMPDDSVVRVEIVGADNRVVRAYNSKRQPAPPGGVAIPPITVKTGLNRVVWDLRTEPVARIPGPNFFMPTEGYRVAPGDYTVRLAVAGRTYTQPLKVVPDPRLQMTAEQIAQQQQMIARIQARANDIFRTVREIQSIRDQVNRVSQAARAANLPQADSVGKLATALRSRLDSLEQSLVQVRSTNGQDIINYRNALIDQVLFLANAVDASGVTPTQPMQQRLGEIDQLWTTLDTRVRTVIQRDVGALNALLAGTPPVIVPRVGAVP